MRWLSKFSWRRYRRWLRLSLRGLMVLILVVGGGIGWLLHAIRVQREAIAVVRAARGYLEFDWQKQQVGVKDGRPVYRSEPAAPRWVRRWLWDELFQNVREVVLFKPVTPGVLASVGEFRQLERLTVLDSVGLGDGLRHLGGMRALRQVTIHGAGVSDVALGQLAAVRSIQTLEITHASASDTGFARLADLPNLGELKLGSNPLTDRGASRLLHGLPGLRDLTLSPGPNELGLALQALAMHHPDLQTLNLRRSAVANADLAAVGRLTQLRDLNLEWTHVSDLGLVHLRPLPNLIRLNVANNAVVTSLGMSSMGALGSLEELDLGSTSVDDAGLAQLGKLANLDWLNVSRTCVTPGAITRFQQALPRATVDANFLASPYRRLPPPARAK